MRPPSYMRCVVERNVVMRRIPVGVTLFWPYFLTTRTRKQQDMTKQCGQSILAMQPMSIIVIWDVGVAH